MKNMIIAALVAAMTAMCCPVIAQSDASVKGLIGFKSLESYNGARIISDGKLVGKQVQMVAYDKSFIIVTLDAERVSVITRETGKVIVKGNYSAPISFGPSSSSQTHIVMTKKQMF
jgi:hypothetical protein